MEKYNPGEIEPKWQKEWEKEGLYRAIDFAKRPKKYVLIEFPYPSGERLHCGHGRTYTALDAVARKLRMDGFNVLFPIGWDAFGLPTENFAIKTGTNPVMVTKENIANAKKQAKAWGLSFDWSREVNTTDPKYYKWTQWIFLKMYEKGLAYKAEVPVSWCPSCKINLADEEVIGGKCERCGAETERRMQKQWLLRITKYAQRLLDDLKTVNYLPKIRIQQENWIGRSEGTDIRFEIPDPTNPNRSYGLWTFTTRPDTLFGVTAIVIAPEKVEEGGHRGLARALAGLAGKKYFEKVEKYIQESEKRSELERTELTKEKTGEFTGVYAINPINKEKIRVWVADYVLGWYGHGAVMLVPAHDQRDFEFAKKYDLEIRPVIKPDPQDPKSIDIGVFDVDHRSVIEKRIEAVLKGERCYDGDGILVNSGEFNGQKSEEARKNITKYLKEHRCGREAVQYKLRDWVFSRQHYWGEPIPIVHCPKCGAVPVPEKDLPVELPYVEKYQPSGTGESPLAAMTEWVNTTCSKCGGPAKRETDTMPNWAGSNWYYLAYLIADKLGNSKFEIRNSKDIFEYWLPVDLYNGGMEHTTLHLLYSRFIYKFLSDIDVVPGNEPYARRHSQGVVLGPDGQKMSKSLGNVVNPDDVVREYGADTFRLYESFMGPFEQMIAWDPEGISGCYRFLRRVWQAALEKVKNKPSPKDLQRRLHQTIKKVSEDIDNLRFNTAIAAMMEFINEWTKGFLSKDDAKMFLQILSPFAPFITEELWRRIGGQFSIHQSPWPQFDPKLAAEEKVTVVVQINGKMRDKLELDPLVARKQEEVEKLAEESTKVKSYLQDRRIKKVIFVPGKLINFVI